MTVLLDVVAVLVLVLSTLLWTSMLAQMHYECIERISRKMRFMFWGCVVAAFSAAAWLVAS